MSSDIRIIVHRMDDSTLVCYVDHHNKAYDWAERRKLVSHPTTGSAQLAETKPSPLRNTAVTFPPPNRDPNPLS